MPYFTGFCLGFRNPSNCFGITLFFLFVKINLNQILNSKSTQQKQWLKSTEVRKMLNISPGTLQNLRINGVLSYTKVGGIIFYAYADLQKVLETNKVEATPNLFNPKWLIR